MVKAVKQKSMRSINKQLILKALTEPRFRKLLEENPTEVLGKKEFTRVQESEIKLVLSMVKGIETLINGVSDRLLCANGGPCGIG